MPRLRQHFNIPLGTVNDIVPEELRYVNPDAKQSYRVAATNKMFCGSCGKLGRPDEIRTTHYKRETIYEGRIEIDYGYVNYNEDDGYIDRYDHSQTAYFYPYEYYYEDYVEYYVCPHCNHHIRPCDTELLNPHTPVDRDMWSGIFVNGNQIKLKSIMKRISCFNDKLQIKMVHNMVIINVETGYSYMFEPHVDGKRDKGYKGPRIKNISYGTVYSLPGVSQETYIELAQLLNKMISAQLGYKVPTIEEYLAQKDDGFSISIGTKQIHWSLRILCLYNRLPNMNSRDLEDLANRCRIIRNAKTRMHKALASIKNTSDNPIGELMRNFKIPETKSLRKLVLEDPTVAIALSGICRYFTDINQIRDIASGNQKNYFENLVISHTTENYSDLFLKEFMKKYDNNQKIVARKIVDLDNRQPGERFYYSGYLGDTARTYAKIRRRAPEIQIDISGTMKEIHDKVHVLYSQLKKENCVLNYNPKDLKLNCDIDGYEFRLAKDTDQMTEIGNLMNICVGGYDDWAIEKKCNIAYMAKDGEYIICIEMTSNLRTVVQAKLKHNRQPKGVELEMIMKWIKMHNLQIKTHDLPTAA